MTFEADETSIESSQPREGVEFVFPAATYRIATGVRDVVINGQTFRVTTARRENANVTVVGGTPGEIEISLVATHDIVQRYLRDGVPPKRVDVNIWQKQLVSGEARQIFAGTLQSIALEGNVARFMAASRLADNLTRRLPTLTSGRACAHVLYSAPCGVDRNAFAASRTIANVGALPGIDGRKIRLDSAPNVTNGWATFGEVLHVASGEYATILDQDDNVLTLQHAIGGAQVGDNVIVYAGCVHDIITCAQKFANQLNYGGQPHKPDRNPWIPNGQGVYESE